MFKQVLLAFVICTAAFGYWKLPLNYKEIKETGTALYPIDAVYLFNSEMG